MNKVKLGVLTLTAFVGIMSPYVIKNEGWKNVGYPDSGGVATSCAGHTATAVIGKYYSDETCFRLLEGDLKPAHHVIKSKVKVDLTEPQVIAIGDFIINLGSGNFSSSTLLRELNNGNTKAACDSILWWKYTKVKGKNVDCFDDKNKKICGGIKTRRLWQREQCLKGAQS